MRRPWPVAALVLSVLCSVLTVVVPSSPASAIGITYTCDAHVASDTCSVTGQTDTSLTVTYDLSFPDPVCDINHPTPDYPRDCVSNLQTFFGNDGASGVTTAIHCDQGKPGDDSGYSPPFTYGTTHATCTGTFSWPATTYPHLLNAQVYLLNGEEISRRYDQIDFTTPRPAPNVAFTSTPDPTTAGLYHFAYSGSSSSPITSYIWTVDGDRESATGPTMDFQFPASGDHLVGLQVTDSREQDAHLNSTIHVVLVDLTALITLAGADGQPFTGGASSVGTTLVAKVTLSVKASASAAVTGIAASPPIAFTPGTALQATGTAPTVPTSVAPGTSASYQQSYKVLTTGAARLTVHVTGTEGSAAQTADDAEIAHLGQPIAVKTVFKVGGQVVPAGGLKLVDTDDGETPQDVVAEVTLTDTSTQDQSNLGFNGPARESFHDHANALPVVPVTVTSGPTPIAPNSLPTSLASGASVTVTYGLHVTNNGVFDTSVLLTSTDAGSDVTNTSAGVGTLTVVPTTIVWIKLKALADLTQQIKPGIPVLLSGSVQNRSTTRTVDLAPFEPKVSGNAGGGALADSSLAVLEDGVRIPLAGMLPPGISKDVDTEIDTLPVPSTRASVTYQPAGLLVQPDGSETDLVPTDFGAKAGSLSYVLSLDQTDLPFDEATAANVVFGFAGQAFATTALWGAAKINDVGDALLHPIDTGIKGLTGIAHVTVAGLTAAKEAAGLLTSLTILGMTADSMTDQQQQKWSDELVSDYEKTSIHADHIALQKAADPILRKFADAYYTGNYVEVAKMSATGLATGGTVIADLVLTDMAFQKLGAFAKARGIAASKSLAAGFLSLGKELRELKLGPGLNKALKGVLEGDDLLANGAKQLTDIYGLTKSQVQKLTAFCKANGITVAVRSRSKAAAELIRKGIAVGKNLVIKLKNVDEVDVAYLGYSRADLNTVVWAEPISKAKFEKNISHLAADDPMRDIATARYSSRVDEWKTKEFHHKLDTWDATGKIKLQFDGASSGTPHLDANRTVYRRFKLEQVKTEHRYYKRLKVGINDSKTARLVAVTQDVDLVALLSGSNSILSPKLRAKAYEYLEDILGIQHPDTVPWVKGGEVLAYAKKNLLKDHARGGELLAVFDPTGGARAGFWDLNATVFDTVTKGGYVFFSGAYNNPFYKAVITIVTKGAGLR